MIRFIAESILDGLGKVRDIVFGVRDARRANVKDALNGYAAGRSAHDAAAQAGKKTPPAP